MNLSGKATEINSNSYFTIKKKSNKFGMRYGAGFFFLIS